MPRARKSRRSIFSSSGRRCGGMGEPSVGTKACMPRLKWRHWESGALKVEDSTRRVWDVKLFTTPLKYDPYMNSVSWKPPQKYKEYIFSERYLVQKAPTWSMSRWSTSSMSRDMYLAAGLRWQCGQLGWGNNANYNQHDTAIAML